MPSPNEPAENKAYMFERRQPFGQSLLWTLQQQYYSTRGVEAWRKAVVPHYVTNNPVLADSYAEIVFALLLDQNRLAAPGESAIEPLHICELGAGTGRFAFHFLSRLVRLCEDAQIEPESFRYVLTDQAESNLQFWREHPRFQPFIARGMLDVAIFETNESDALALQIRGKTISADSLQRPLVVIANYVFDSIPQDLFRFDEQGAHRGLVSLVTSVDPNTLEIAQLMEQLELHYSFESIAGPPYEEPSFQEIFAIYQRSLKQTLLFFPAPGLRCIQRLKALSKKGLVLLSADKGDHRLAALDGKDTPGVVRHGSVSLSVNFHAFKAFCELNGGLALFPAVQHRSLDVGCCLMVPQASLHREVRQAYRRHVEEFGPDDFYTIIRSAADHIGKMEMEDMLAYLRLSHYDSDLFGRYLLRSMELAPQFDHRNHAAVLDAIDRVSNLYFPLGEHLDLAHGIGCLLYLMKEYEAAVVYFERSTRMYGEHPRTFCNMVMCYQGLGQTKKAETLLRKALELDPANEQANQLMAAMSHASSPARTRMDDTGCD